VKLRALAFFTLPLAMLAAAEPAEALLKQVDRMRYPWPSFSVEVSIQSGKVRQQWLVRVRENGDARVEGLSEKEKGRTVLLLGDEMWLLLPNSKNPVKVSPQQRLLGPAAGGDIARFRFTEDYKALKESEETMEGRTCKRIELQARRPAISYRTATLWISDGRPMRANFFLASGKLGRTVQFGASQTVRGQQVLSGMSFKDPAGQQADLRFEAWKPSTTEDALFQLPTRRP